MRIHDLLQRAHAAGRMLTGQTARTSSGADAGSAVARWWGHAAAERQRTPLMGWLDSPLVRDHYVLEAVAQGPSQGDFMLDLAARHRWPRDGHWLSLGCGSAGQEIFYSQNKLFGSMDAYDISSQAIQIARDNAARSQVANIRFQTADFHDLILPPETYDMAIMIMSLHHVTNLDRLLSTISGGLKPGGWLVVNEYVGPARFQFSDKQMQIVEELLDLLPARLKHDYVHNSIKQRYVVQPPAYWDQIDPSEAIYSDQIPAALERHFVLVHRYDYGGTLLNPLLEHIVGNFSAKKEEDVSLLRLLAYVEKALIREACLSSDFALFVMRTCDKSP